MGEVRFMISEAAKKVQVESHVLRYWEEELHIPIGRTEMGHRYYTQDDIQLFCCIKKLKNEGVLLRDLKPLIPELKSTRQIMRHTENKEKNALTKTPAPDLTSIGANSYANFNFTCVDCCPVTIGANVFMGPNVSLLTPMHPLRWQDRNQYQKQNGTLTDKEYARPITIGDNCWIAGNVTICGGVTIGEGCVIGAGSVVTRDIPANSLAVGVPCRVIREITEEDALENRPVNRHQKKAC